MWSHRDYGAYVANEYSTVITGHDYKPAKARPIIWFGGLATDREFLDAAFSGPQIAPKVAEYGNCAIFQGEMGGLLWGSDTAQTRIGQAWSYVKTLTGCATDKMILVGLSKGVLGCLNYARNNPTKVAAVVGMIPAVNLQNVYTDTGVPGQTSIEAAYTDHAGYLAALATHDPSLNIETHATQGIPMKFIYGDADTVVRPADILEFAEGVGAETQAIAGGTHTSTPPAVIPSTHVLDFITPYL